MYLSSIVNGTKNVKIFLRTNDYFCGCDMGARRGGTKLPPPPGIFGKN
jgi:hypothetical protein